MEKYKKYTVEKPQKSQASSLTSTYVLGAMIPLVLGLAYWWITPGQHWTCYIDLTDGDAQICKLKCPKNHFSIPWMDSCQPWLTCREIESRDFKVIKHIGNGAVKMVYLAEWNGYEVALNTLLNSKYKADYNHGLKMLIALHGNPHVTQLIGYCRNSYVTEYHKLGSANNLKELLQEGNLLAKYSDVKHMLGLCASYAENLVHLHNSTIGTRVMCDSNDLDKTLNQYLMTADLRLVANDLDALPEVNTTANKLIKCGHRPLYGDFVAPEQVWVHDDLEFDDNLLAPYDEKTDIWKLPDVCTHFLDLAQGSDPVKFHLYKMHKQCKSKDPQSRPSAVEVLETYQTILGEL